MKQLAKIYIKDIAVTGIVGAYEKERVEPQTMFISLELSIDASTLIKTDDLNDTVDYMIFYKKIPNLIASAQFYLIESVASAVLDMCLAEKGVLGATVTVEKPQALDGKGVYIEMTRENT